MSWFCLWSIQNTNLHIFNEWSSFGIHTWCSHATWCNVSLHCGRGDLEKQIKQFENKVETLQSLSLRNRIWQQQKSTSPNVILMILSLDLRRTVSCLVEFDHVTLAACPRVTPSPEKPVSPGWTWMIAWSSCKVIWVESWMSCKWKDVDLPPHRVVGRLRATGHRSIGAPCEFGNLLMWWPTGLAVQLANTLLGLVWFWTCVSKWGILGRMWNGEDNRHHSCSFYA